MAAGSTRNLQLWTIIILIMLYSKAPYTTLSQILDEKLYIVYMGDLPSTGSGDSNIAALSHQHMLRSVLGSHDAAQKSLKHSYGKSFSGFAAWLSPSHVQQLSNTDGVVSVFESKKLKPSTTRSWDFVGLPSVDQNSNLEYQSDVIIALLDTGIWPESESFSDAGFGPLPAKWRGMCQTTPDFKACNRKIVGARFYNYGVNTPLIGESFSPRDIVGHGTHTSSTAAGNLVKNASLYGIAQGDARGGVPGARIAMYKVCWLSIFCEDADILAAFDDAIYDGVDVISVSIGGSYPVDYFEDSIAIGPFHAMKRGILTSTSAGNSGEIFSLTNYSPWSLTVAASTIDRQMETQLLLGNGHSILGISLNTFQMDKQWYPLIYGGDAFNVSGGYTSRNSSYCHKNSLDSKKVEGKIVLCHVDSDTRADEEVFECGGAGVIIISHENKDTAVPFRIPATKISTTKGEIIKSYIKSSSLPLAKILKTATQNDVPAPVVASFSSRGPNPITLDILKPDITAPGVNILAAWTKNLSLTSLPGETRFPNYNIMSGTSMACPHAAGVAAYVKSYHSDWSPSAIKSAIMTTASAMDATLTGNEDREFGYGAGQIDPVKAMNPGLVYDADVDSYINMLCSEGYNKTTLFRVTGSFVECPQNVSKHGARELNYPSIMVVSKPAKPVSAIFQRTVTNVGPAESTYKVLVNAPSGMNVTVKPDTLAFSAPNQKLSYKVKVEGNVIPKNTVLTGALTWNYGNISVRSPIVVYCHTHVKH